MILQWKTSTCRITLVSILTALTCFFILRLLFSGFSAPAKNRSTVKGIRNLILESVPKDYDESVKKKPDLCKSSVMLKSGRMSRETLVRECHKNNSSKCLRHMIFQLF